METNVHPRLRKVEEEAQAEPEVIEEPVAESIESQDETTKEDESKYLVTFDRRNAAKEFARWQKDEDTKDLANHLNSFVGQKARREWKPKLDEVELKLAESEARWQRTQAQSMTPDQVKERLLNDPQFRQTYGRVVDPEAKRQQLALESALETAQEAVAAVLTDDEVAGFRKSLEGGWYDYDRDESGKPIRALHPQESLARYNRDLFAAAQAKAGGAVAPPPATRPAGPPPPPTITPSAPAAAKPKAAPNPKLAQASPDLSQPSSGGAGGTRMKMSEYRALTPPERIRLFPDLEAAVRSGQIIRD